MAHRLKVFIPCPKATHPMPPDRERSVESKILRKQGPFEMLKLL
jgi:hypothetical protein